jgi:hypothetical protein
MLETPVAEADERILIVPLGGEFYGLSCASVLPRIRIFRTWRCRVPREGLPFDMMDTTFFLSRENIVADKGRPGMVLWRDKLFAFMARNAMPATAFFQIPGNRLIELGRRWRSEANAGARAAVDLHRGGQEARWALDHVLIFGPPGLGKTTLSHIIAPNWASTCARPPARCWSARAIWPRC